MAERIGVYVCHCGSNIAGKVDVEDVAKWAGATEQLPTGIAQDLPVCLCMLLRPSGALGEIRLDGRLDDVAYVAA